MLRVASSRRATAPRPTDYDHEISLVDHDAARTPPEATTPEPVDMVRSDTTARLLETDGEDQQTENQLQQDHQKKDKDKDQTRKDENGTAPANPQAQNEDGQPSSRPGPTIAIRQPTAPDISCGNGAQTKPRKSVDDRESVIDILYENERGGFLCGIALFSSQALGGLDPPAWTNVYHNASPTNIHTAQVPDPSWEWAWPEWRVNHQDGVDEDGWEYAFAFSKKFSWHRARWWNSFVRRRAWTRKRVKKRPEDISADPHMLNTNYFTVRPAAERGHRSRDSIVSSRHASRTSFSQLTAAEETESSQDIEYIEDLLTILRRSRIDREKLEVVENYLEHGLDLSQLQEEMHEIMSIFVFQASRRILLSHLMHIYDEITEQLKKKETPELKARGDAIKDAVKHAEEEVRKLAYWSDVKQMADNGDIKNAVDCEEGWDDNWRGLDKSGGAHPKEG